MRNMGNARRTITATPRQLESMIRVAESIAKMRLATEVTMKDVEEAVRLIKTAMQQSATDPKTGQIDMDLITTGVSASSKIRIKEIGDFVRSIQSDFRDRVNEHGIKYQNLFDFINAKARDGAIKDIESVTEQEFRDCLVHLEDQQIVNLVGHKMAPTIRFVNTD